MMPTRTAPTKISLRRFDGFAGAGLLGGFLSAGFGSAIFYFISLSKLNLADAVVLNSAAPVFVTLYYSIWKRTLPPRLVLFYAPLAFIGVALILKPQYGFFNSDGIWGLISSASAGVAFLTLHGIARKFKPAVIVGYFTGISTLLLLPVIPTFKLPQNPSQWGLLLAIGLTATIAQDFMTRGYARLNAITAAQLANFTVLFGAVLGAIMLGELPRWNFYVGSALVVFSCAKLIRLPVDPTPSPPSTPAM